jgi:hypothetical protein
MISQARGAAHECAEPPIRGADPRRRSRRTPGLGQTRQRKQSAPLHLAASGSLEVGQQPTIVLAGDGTELVLGDSAARMEGMAMPPARELLAKLRPSRSPSIRLTSLCARPWGDRGRPPEGQRRLGHAAGGGEADRRERPRSYFLARVRQARRDCGLPSGLYGEQAPLAGNAFELVHTALGESNA